MQILKDYAGDYAPVKPFTVPGVPRVTCRINTCGGVLRLFGTLAEVLAWMQTQCPGGKMVELSLIGNPAEVRA